MDDAFSQFSTTVYTAIVLIVLSGFFNYIVLGLICRRAGLGRESVKHITSLGMLICIFVSIEIARNVR
ncbi:MAG: hypothetical protein CMF68_10295 [Magnetovibrio sp.]|nr:hypothetical protein [Magnetovibrio sp.]